MNIQTEKLLQYDVWYGEWIAYNADNYDGLEDGNNTIGTGDSISEAIEDLFDKYSDLDTFEKHEAIIKYYHSIKYTADWNTLRDIMLLSNRLIKEMESENAQVNS